MLRERLVDSPLAQVDARQQIKHFGQRQRFLGGEVRALVQRGSRQHQLALLEQHAAEVGERLRERSVVAHLP